MCNSFCCRVGSLNWNHFRGHSGHRSVGFGRSAALEVADHDTRPQGVCQVRKGTHDGSVGCRKYHIFVVGREGM